MPRVIFFFFFFFFFFLSAVGKGGFPSLLDVKGGEIPPPLNSFFRFCRHTIRAQPSLTLNFFFNLLLPTLESLGAAQDYFFVPANLATPWSSFWLPLPFILGQPACKDFFRFPLFPLITSCTQEEVTPDLNPCVKQAFRALENGLGRPETKRNPPPVPSFLFPYLRHVFSEKKPVGFL